MARGAGGTFVQVLDDDRLDELEKQLRYMDRELRNEWRRAQGAKLSPIWRSAAQRAAIGTNTQTDRTFARGFNVERGEPPTLVFKGSTRQIGRSRLKNGRPRTPPGDGLVPATMWRMVEFGSKGDYGRTGKLPRHARQGRVVFPAVADAMPKATSVWLGIMFDILKQMGWEQ